jgi:hypothetical protein
MSGVVVFTPSSNAGPSPRQPDHSSPGNALPSQNQRSGMAVVALDSLKTSRAHLFIRKDQMALLSEMTLQEQMYGDYCVLLIYFADKLQVSPLIGCTNSGNSRSELRGLGVAGHGCGIQQISSSINFWKEKVRSCLFHLTSTSTLQGLIHIAKALGIGFIMDPILMNRVHFANGVSISARSATRELLRLR